MKATVIRSILFMAFVYMYTLIPVDLGVRKTIFPPEIFAHDDLGVSACIEDKKFEFDGAKTRLDLQHENLHNLNLTLSGIVFARLNWITLKTAPRVAEAASLAALAALEWGRTKDYENALTKLEKNYQDEVKACRASGAARRSAMAQLHAESIENNYTDSNVSSSSPIPTPNYGSGTVTVGRVN